MLGTVSSSTSNSHAATLVALPRLLTQKDLAAYLGKSLAWCERARWDGKGPQFVKLGRNVRYRAEDVLAWIDANARVSTTDPDGRKAEAMRNNGERGQN